MNLIKNIFCFFICIDSINSIRVFPPMSEQLFINNKYDPDFNMTKQMTKRDLSQEETTTFDYFDSTSINNNTDDSNQDIEDSFENIDGFESKFLDVSNTNSSQEEKDIDLNTETDFFFESTTQESEIKSDPFSNSSSKEELDRKSKNLSLEKDVNNIKKEEHNSSKEILKNNTFVLFKKIDIVNQTNVVNNTPLNSNQEQDLLSEKFNFTLDIHSEEKNRSQDFKINETQQTNLPINTPETFLVNPHEEPSELVPVPVLNSNIKNESTLILSTPIVLPSVDFNQEDNLSSVTQTKFSDEHIDIDTTSDVTLPKMSSTTIPNVTVSILNTSTTVTMVTPSKDKNLVLDVTLPPVLNKTNPLKEASLKNIIVTPTPDKSILVSRIELADLDKLEKHDSLSTTLENDLILSTTHIPNATLSPLKFDLNQFVNTTIKFKIQTLLESNNIFKNNLTIEHIKDIKDVIFNLTNTDLNSFNLTDEQILTLFKTEFLDSYKNIFLCFLFYDHNCEQINLYKTIFEFFIGCLTFMILYLIHLRYKVYNKKYYLQKKLKERERFYSMVVL